MKNNTTQESDIEIDSFGKRSPFPLWTGISLVALIFASAFATYYISSMISSQRPISPTAPESKPEAASCTEQCPGSDGVLRSCHPADSDGTANESLCNRVGRVETCGPKTTPYCCDGKKWTKDMSACETTTPTPSTTISPTTSISPTATVTPGIGAVCENVKIYAKKTDGSFASTPMTTTELAKIKIGDTVRLKVSGSTTGLRSRFRITIAGVVQEPEWKVGVGSVGSQYYDYEITKEGTIKFEGQVSTK